MDTEDYTWIGLALPQDVGDTRVMVTPLAFYDAEASSWESVDIETRKHYFPNEGKVIVFEREWVGCEPNRLYRFQPETNRQSKVSPDAHSYAKYWIPRSLSPTTLAEVLDWTRLAATAELPALLARQEPFTNVRTQRVYIRHDSRVYGPIHLDTRTGLPREYAQSTATGGPPLMVKSYAISSGALIHLMQHDERIVLLDEERLDTPLGEADWSLPQVVIKRVLEASSQLPSGAGDDAHLVDKRVKELARVASARGPDALRLPPATLHRALSLVGDQQAVLAALDTLGTTLVGQPALRPRIDAAIAQETRARAEEIGRTVAEQIADQQRALSEAQDDVHAARACLAALTTEISDAREQKDRLQQEFASFESVLAQRVGALKAEPMQTLADLHLTRLLLPALAEPATPPLDGAKWRVTNGMALPRSKAGTVGDDTPEANVIGNVTWQRRESGEQITTADALKREWISAARQFGARSQDVRACAAALLAGLIPTPKGEGTWATLSALGDALAGGRAWSVPVPVTALSPVDLFGAIDPTTREFIPAAGALSDIVLAAREHPDELGLVIFEGWDRVPGMPTYVPFLRHYLDVQRHVAGALAPAPLSLFHPRALAPSDPYISLAWLSWPPNLLIAGILDETDGSFPIPSEYTSWLIRPETHPAPQRTPRPEGAARSAVRASTWGQWRMELRGADAGGQPDSETGQNAQAALLVRSLRLLGVSSETECETLAQTVMGAA